MRQEIEKGII